MHNLSGFVKRLRDIMRNDAGINGDAQRIEQIAWLLFLKVYDAKSRSGSSRMTIIPRFCLLSAAGPLGRTMIDPAKRLLVTNC